MAQRNRFGGRFDGILAGARRGEPEALGEIYNTLAPVVAGYLRMQGCREPDDLTSEVFVGVLRNLPAFDVDGDEAAFRSWVFTIAQRRLLDERRRMARKPTPSPLSSVVDPMASDDVEASVALALEADHIRALAAQLPPEQRDVVLLRLLGRLTVGDVAATLGKSEGGVKALQRRGFQTIGRLLESEATAR